MEINQHETATVTPLLQRIGPGVFSAPMGLLGCAHVLHQLSLTEGAPFAAASTGVFVIGAAVLVVLTLLYAARGFVVKGGVRADFSDPVKMNFSAAFAIALVLGAGGLGIFGLPGAEPLLLAGSAASFVCAVVVVRQWFRLAIAPGDITPDWFVPVASTLVAAKALGVGGFPTLGFFMAGLGFFGWLMVLPLVLRRLIVEPMMPRDLMPTLFILIAPPGLAANAALTLLPETLALPAALTCLGIGIFFLAVLVTMFVDFEKAGFSLAAWSYTFPTAALASASLAVAAQTGISGLVLMAHGLAGLNIALTLGVSVMAVRNLCQRAGNKKAAPAG